jgi:iron complex outermembrane receptor protein
MGLSMKNRFPSAFLLLLAAAASHDFAAATDATTAAVAEAGSNTAADTGLQTVTVTATRTVQDIKDIPISVSAVDADELASHHVVNYDDITRTVPGISFQAGPQPGLNNIAIRGVSSTSGSATVGIYVDDVSVTVKNTYDGSIQPKMFDLDRVEVLRGPQGTLFGASSMGGTIRFITHKADVNDFSLSGSTDVSDTEHGSVNNDSYAILNLPVVSGKFALRFGADVDYLSGYVNHYTPTATGNGVGSDGNPISLYTNDSTGVLSDKGVNTNLIEVLRVSGNYVGDDGLSVVPDVRYQVTRSGDAALYFPSLGLYEQDKHVREPGKDELFLSSLTATKSWDAVEFTSVTGFFRRDFLRTQDGTLYNSSIFANYLLPPALESEQPPGYTFHPAPTADQLTATYNILGFLPSPVLYDTITNQVSQELRLASKEPFNIGVPVHWQAGVYFANQHLFHEDYEVISGLQADFTQIYGYNINDSYVNTPGQNFDNDLLYLALSHNSEKQIAPFGEAVFDLTSALHATVGLRYVYAKSEFSFNSIGYFSVGEPANYTAKTNFSATTPKFSLDYALNDDANVYTTVAKGFRLGGPTGPDPANIPGGPCDTDYSNLGIPGAPLQYNSDSLWSYEVGTKGRYLNNRLSVNAAVYTIDWKNIQQTIILPICGFTFTTNAGDARIYGSELEINALVTSNWTLSLNGGNSHGYITSTLEPGIFGVGEDLLNVPLYTATASSDYEIPLNDQRSLFINADFPYVGRSHAYYATQQVPVHYNPGYGILNLAFGFMQHEIGSEHHTLTVSLYAQNVLDNHRTIQYPSVFQVQEAYTVRPLTVGIAISLLQ